MVLTDKIVILSTCGSAEEAELVARTLLQEQLAACVNIVQGVRSLYRWKGAIEDSQEWLLIIKTRRDLVPGISEALRRVHTYEIPEVVAIPVVDGLAEYLEWIDRETVVAPVPE